MADRLAAEQIEMCQSLLDRGETPPEWLVRAILETALLGVPEADKRAAELDARMRDWDWLYSVEEMRAEQGISERKACKNIYDEESGQYNLDSDEAVRKAIRRARGRQERATARAVREIRARFFAALKPVRR